MYTQYNYSFEVAAIIYTILMYIFLRLQYPVKTELNLEFRKLVLLCLFTTIMDVISGIGIANGAVIPPMVNMVINTIYMMATIVFGFQFVYYSMCFVYEAPESQLSTRMNRAVCMLYGVLLVINFFTGWVFSFGKKGEYIHGPIYIVSFLVPLYYMLYAGIHFMRKNERCTKRQKGSLLLGVAFTIGGCLLQIAFFPDVLLGMFTASLAMFAMLFTMETPNYRLLTETMDTLEKTREEAQEAQIRAQDANKAKSRFLSNVSQEVKAPIKDILFYDEKILEECKDETLLQWAQQVRVSGRTLLAMMNNILDFTILDEGKVKLDKKNYSTQSFLQDMCCHAEYAMGEKKLDLVLTIDKWIPRELSGDAYRLLQIMGNLISNAAKFTEEGSVEISVMWEASNQEEGVLEFRIQDTGIGMSEEEIRNVTNSFVKLSGERIEKLSGLGLGLSIVMLLLESMDSHLEIISKPGKGSLFFFAVKQKIVDNQPIGRNEFYGNLRLSDMKEELGFEAPGKRVLLIEDNVLNQDLFRGKMKDSKMEIEVAGHGEEALEKMRKYNYDFIFIDMLMPKLNGEETLAIKKKEHLCEDSIVFAMGGDPLEEVREKYLGMGFYDYVAKPFVRQDIEELLKRYL